ncbi:MAG: alpha/beta fold hydrolase [Deltaproteobacteria bacterium]|nr:alpha/beta fold hydrolase [Deltaproteobacteria bacterium]
MATNRDNAIARRLVRLADGVSLLAEGGTRTRMGNAPKSVIFKQWKLTVSHVLPRRLESDALGDDHVEDHEQTFAIPVLLVPPLMVRPYVYDLRPDHSFARHLRDAGFATYVLDFGVPDAHDASLLLEHYVYTFLPAAIDAVLRHSGAKQVSLVGYCMGGIFSMLYTAATLPRDGAGSKTANLVTIGAPINFEKTGIISAAAKFGQGFIDQLMDVLGNVPSVGAELGFKVLSGSKSITKWIDLARNLYDDEYVRGFDAVNTWVNDMLPYPRDAFKQMVKDVVGKNKILRRELELGGNRIDLAVIQAPLLAIAGRNDNIATLASTRAVLASVSSQDKTFVEVSGGHVGVIAGSSAPEQVWQRVGDWLAPRSLGSAPA